MASIKDTDSVTGGVKSLRRPADSLDEGFVDEGRRAGSVSGDGAPGDEAGHFWQGEAGRGRSNRG